MYLYNKYAWKGNQYTFTFDEIKKALGYAETTKSADKLIKANVESLKAEGLIDYQEITQQREVGDKVLPIKRKKLIFVVEELSKEKLATLDEKK